VRHVVLIVNPYSSGVTWPQVAQIETVLRRSADVVRRQTEAPGHATELAREAAESADAIVVYSGDGTYNEAVNGVTRDVPFGFVPGGGASVMPRALGLPRDAVAAARTIATALADGRTRSISLGRVNGRRFLFAAGIGFDGEAVRRIEDRGRTADGRRANNLVFALAVVRSLLERRLRFDPQLEIEGYGRAAFVFVANGSPYTYAKRVPIAIAPEAQFELGLDLVAPIRVRRRSLVHTALSIVTGHTRNRSAVLYGHDLDRIEVACDGPMPLHADGEDLGDVAEAVFEAERGAVSVLV